MKKILFILTALAIMITMCSCEKREPEVQPDPGEIMREIAVQYPECKNTVYESGNIIKELTYAKAARIYSGGKNKPADMSKIEKYSVAADPDTEVGIFKLYDRGSADYVKRMAQTRISKMRTGGINLAAIIANNAEARSYGNYVYYVSHPEKDKIFEIIEDMLRGV